MDEGQNKDIDADVSNIHKRWSFTTLTPSSFKWSFTGSVLCGAAVVIATHLYYIQSNLSSSLIYAALAGGVLALLHFADHYALRGAPMNKLSKVAHVDLFANVLWLLTALLGIASDAVFSKDILHLDYIVAGMLLAAGLRAGIFVSVFGSSLKRAVPVSFLMPVIFLFVFVPGSAYPALFSSYAGFGFGAALYLLGVIWVVVADRAGRPLVASTFGLLQAFLSAWTENDSSKMEEYTESRAHDELVQTNVIRFYQQADRTFVAAMVLPDVHPGPFGSVGGSNLPYVLYQNFSRRALVMHSVSDHSLNIPSKREVEKYLEGISSQQVLQSGNECTQPVQVKQGKATATGIAFGRTAVVMLSLSPHGMEDVPNSVKAELESHGRRLGFSDVLVVDCHNAMGKHVVEHDRVALAESAKQCLDELLKKPQLKFKIGYSSLGSEAGGSFASQELGQSGIAALALLVGDQKYVIGWADSNNMANGLRDKITATVGSGLEMLEVCTSDTHSTSGKKTREGYFPLGTTDDAGRIASAFDSVSRRAVEQATGFCGFEIARSSSTVKVMGKKQFGDYSTALDRSMNVTKVFVGITAATYIAMLVFA